MLCYLANDISLCNIFYLVDIIIQQNIHIYIYYENNVFLCIQILLKCYFFNFIGNSYRKRIGFLKSQAPNINIFRDAKEKKIQYFIR